MANTDYFAIADALYLTVAGVSNATVDSAVVHVGGSPGLDYTVMDGPPAGEGYPENAVFLGWDGDPEGDYEAALMQQQWAGSIGANRRDETVEIPGSVIVHYGDGDRWKPARDRTLLIHTDIETKLRAAADLGLGVNGVRQYIVAEFKPTAAYQEPAGDSGYWFRTVFAVSVNTRI